MKTIYVIVCSILLTACASVGTINKNYEFAQLNDQALLVLSITNKHAAYLNGPNQFAPSLKIRDKSGNRSFTLKGHVGSIMDRHLESETGWTIGRVIAAELPPGDYEVYDWDSVKLAFHPSARTIRKPSILFELTPGKATYIGNIDLYINQANQTYSLEVFDERERDFKEVTAKWPKLKVDEIKVSLAKNGV